MKHRPTHFKRWLLVLPAIAAAAVWTFFLFNRPSFDEAALRDTQGIEAIVLDCQRVAHGYQVRCVVRNHRGRAAAAIALKASVLDTHGQVLAANPLVGVQNLAAGQQQELGVLVSTATPAANTTAALEVSLVKWGDKPDKPD